MFLIIIIILFSFFENLVKQINITILALKKNILMVKIINVSRMLW